MSTTPMKLYQSMPEHKQKITLSSISLLLGIIIAIVTIGGYVKIFFSDYATKSHINNVYSELTMSNIQTQMRVMEIKPTDNWSQRDKTEYEALRESLVNLQLAKDKRIGGGGLPE